MGALLTALSLVLMALTSVLPTLQYTLVAAAGLLPAVMVIRYKLSGGWMVYTATALLAAILLPDKEAALLYIILFGHYPMVKSLIEQIKRSWLQWVLKLAVCNTLTLAAIFIAQWLFAAGLDLFELPVGLFLIVVNFVFVIYDIAFTRLISYFYPRLQRGIEQKN